MVDSHLFPYCKIKVRIIDQDNFLTKNIHRTSTANTCTHIKCINFNLNMLILVYIAVTFYHGHMNVMNILAASKNP